MAIFVQHAGGHGKNRNSLQEVDERVELDDAAVAAVIEKLVKQRKDSVTQYEAAGRQDLADIEKAEISILSAYLPEKMSNEEIAAAVAAAVAQTC